jgi:hypothetical protein
VDPRRAWLGRGPRRPVGMRHMSGMVEQFRREGRKPSDVEAAGVESPLMEEREPPPPGDLSWSGSGVPAGSA